VRPWKFALLVSACETSLKHVTYEEFLSWKRVKSVREEWIGYGGHDRAGSIWKFDLNGLSLHSPCCSQFGLLGRTRSTTHKDTILYLLEVQQLHPRMAASV
jgi:hypothetical protein